MSGSPYLNRSRMLARSVALGLLVVISSGGARDGGGSGTSNSTASRPAAAQGVPDCSDPAWRTPPFDAWLAPAVRRAEIFAKSELPAWDDAAYTEFSRNGRREAGERMLRQRLEPLTTLVLAECKERRGRFLPAVERTLDALAQQPTWTLPAGDPGLANLHGKFSVDLNACETSHDVAWALRLMRPYLQASTRDRVESALEQRIFKPLQATLDNRRRGGGLGPHWWIEGKSNWNAVCVASVVGAAFALDRKDLADWLAFGRTASVHYLGSFNDDGYSDEGPLYWNYGFGHFLRLREILLAATAGAYDLMRQPKAQAMAAYPARIEMPFDVVPLYGDASTDTQIDPVKQAHAEVTIGWASTEDWMRLARPTGSGGRLNEALWRLWGEPRAAAIVARDATTSCTLFPTSGVAVFRPEAAPDALTALSFSLRVGGSRAHAHDDAGSYAVALGRTLIAGDLGGPTYTRETFGPNRRSIPLVSSYGHPVPVVDGQVQLASASVAAKWRQSPCGKQTSQDGPEVAVIDLQGVYEVDGLRTLTRTFAYDRHRGTAIVVMDRFSADRPLRFETALTTHAEVTALKDDVAIQGRGAEIRVGVRGSQAVELVTERNDGDPRNRYNRVALRLRDPSSSGCIVYRIATTAQPLPKWVESIRC